MFGVVPKVLWNKLTPADPKNRIRLALNCLLIKTNEKCVLVDTGIGDKFDSKLEEIYRMERVQDLFSSLAHLGMKPDDIDVVINTHLHFDHCGGNTIEKNVKYVPTFPNAEYIIQEKEWHAALNTDEKTKSSYRRSDFMPLEEAGQLTLVGGEYEVTPGVRVIPTAGHTSGHQSVLITSEGQDALYLGDLIPTTYHLKIPYLTGYDQYPVDLIKCKKDIIKNAVKSHWLLIFEHDPTITFAYLKTVHGQIIPQPIQGQNSKSQTPSSKQILIDQNPKSKPYDLGERTLQFAINVMNFVKKVPRTLGNIENSRQLIRSSGSVGANYVEANEALSKKDFLMRIKICRKESKESAYWLKCIESGGRENEKQRLILIEEATELLRIFNAIAVKSK